MIIEHWTDLNIKAGPNAGSDEALNISLISADIGSG